MKDIHGKIYDFLQGCPACGDWFFNFAPCAADNNMLATGDGSYWVKRYVDGTGLKGYDFHVIMFKDFSTEYGGGTENIDAINQVQEIILWLKKQIELRNFPDIGFKIASFTVPMGVPLVSGQNEKGAKYMFPVKIRYYERNI